YYNGFRIDQNSATDSCVVHTQRYNGRDRDSGLEYRHRFEPSRIQGVSGDGIGKLWSAAYDATQTTTNYTVTGLQNGTTYFFVITAYDSAGNESTYSNEVSKSIS